MKMINQNRTAKMGLISLATALLLAAVLLLTNVLAAKLPADVKTLDLTADKKFSVTDSTAREIAKNITPILFPQEVKRHSPTKVFT